MPTTTWLKPDQVDALRDACYNDDVSNYAQSRNDALIALTYDAGLRPTELVSVTVEMLDLDDGTLRLPTSVQKDYPNNSTPSPATIKLARTKYTSDTVRTLRSYLDSRWKESDYLFSSKKNHTISTRSVRRVLQQSSRIAVLKPYKGNAGRGGPGDVSPYSLRHSVAYRMLSASDEDFTLYDVRNRLRHRSIKTTEKHYDHFNVV